MQVTLTKAQLAFIEAYIARHEGVSVEDVLNKALEALERADGFDMSAHFTALEIADIRLSIIATQAELYFSSEEIAHWAASLGQRFHERA
jgi:hypothetical protein